MTPLRQKLLDAVLQRGYSINTYDSYAVAVKQLIKFYHRPPDQISLCELQSFFEYLVKERKLSPHQSQVCSHILTCHTPALGSVAEQRCDQCDYTRPCYHSCRDRHCPSCQRDASEAWCERQREALLPVTYHHLVFTLPSSLNAWVSLHPKVIYRAHANQPTH